MKTASWFTYSGPGRIGISRSVPRKIGAGYRRYTALQPGPWFSTVEEDQYHVLYAEILARLDPKRVWNDLHALVPPNIEPVLLCWEPAGEFCHRRLVADWLRDRLGVCIPEHDPGAPSQW